MNFQKKKRRKKNENMFKYWMTEFLKVWCHEPGKKQKTYLIQEETNPRKSDI